MAPLTVPQLFPVLRPKLLITLANNSWSRPDIVIRERPIAIVGGNNLSCCVLFESTFREKESLEATRIATVVYLSSLMFTLLIPFIFPFYLAIQSVLSFAQELDEN